MRSNSFHCHDVSFELGNDLFDFSRKKPIAVVGVNVSMQYFGQSPRMTPVKIMGI
jgi:hypothetical protein